MQQFNADGYIPAGIHTYSYEEFYRQFVVDFPSSQTRGNIKLEMFKWLEELGRILGVSTPVEIWLDGSFISGKANPNDIDTIIYLDVTSPSLSSVWETVKSHQAIAKSHLCDIYFATAITSSSNHQDINMRNYWRGQFGFDRLDVPKGIITLPWSEVIKGFGVQL